MSVTVMSPGVLAGILDAGRVTVPGTLTAEQAQVAGEFHHAVRCQSGGACYRVRRNGRTRMWASRPGEFRLPVKWGLRLCTEITHADLGDWHEASTCPRCT